MSAGEQYLVTDTRTGRPVNAGDTVTSFRGEPATFEHVSRGPLPDKSAKVVVRWLHQSGDVATGQREYYAGVFRLDVVPTGEAP